MNQRIPLLLDRVLEVSGRFPEKTCTIRDGQRVSYGEVRELISLAAATLQGSIDPGDRVAVLLDNSSEYIATCYGIWAAGGVLVALNTALRAEELASRICHCRATTLLIDIRHRELEHLRSLMPDSVRVVEVDPAHPFPDHRSQTPGPALSSAGSASSADSLASIIYTSGTTGHPKGVMLSHGNLAANTESICRYLPIGPDDKALCVLPFPYSYGASVLHSHLVNGATLLLEDSLLYPHRILRRVVEEGATSLAGVPSTFYLLLQRTDVSNFDLSSMRYVTQAGARMDPAHIQEFQTLVPSADFFVMYGQTEATARLAYVPPEWLNRKPGSAGRAIPGVEFRIVDEEGREVPGGQVGEVCARGANVMLGYWDEPAESARVLREGWLLTGDMGHLDQDGFLFLSGRSREMIKSGAHRIAPAEIEEVIRRIPGVTDVAVAGIEDDILGEAVKAWVISPDTSEAMKRVIRRACQLELARFKVPKVVEFRQEFPKTGSGKVRKHQL